jgi:hypothetical protein
MDLGAEQLTKSFKSEEHEHNVFLPHLSYLCSLKFKFSLRKGRARLKRKRLMWL